MFFMSKISIINDFPTTLANRPPPMMIKIIFRNVGSRCLQWMFAPHFADADANIKRWTCSLFGKGLSLTQFLLEIINLFIIFFSTCILGFRNRGIESVGPYFNVSLKLMVHHQKIIIKYIKLFCHFSLSPMSLSKVISLVSHRLINVTIFMNR